MDIFVGRNTWFFRESLQSTFITNNNCIE